jgi:5'-phosphate synthase pdxT subunit
LAIGVLALQGAVAEHIERLRRLGAEAREVREPHDLDGLEGIILPGGESTTLGKLMRRIGLDSALREFAGAGKPMFGTCAGMILMARSLDGNDQPLLGLMDMKVRRNAFGRQVDSFEQDLEVAGLDGDGFRGVFIRAPYVVETGPEVSVLAQVDGHGVLVRQGRLMAAAFHPELTDDLRVHRMFLEMARGADVDGRLPASGAAGGPVG